MTLSHLFVVSWWEEGCYFPGSRERDSITWLLISVGDSIMWLLIPVGSGLSLFSILQDSLDIIGGTSFLDHYLMIGEGAGGTRLGLHFPLLGEVGGRIRCPSILLLQLWGPYHFSFLFISFRISFGCLLFYFRVYVYLGEGRIKTPFAPNWKSFEFSVLFMWSYGI